ncbi:hypothetical protein SAMN04487949_2166 [Halogranum gelatinilyticum]|uniref:HIT zinc finger n=1 Tax=Halogranum gelatinilyticum TaxID=660521 RepID=A0A1G9UF35_9EURY|nr:hypothetical protein [Halogranum gelatinilyticum]SDM58567.1 hypothetical protein SAMN04487949_2166 [Halogranum gelatinilyticum]
MSVTGLCQVCESATATRGCRQCGTNVCEKHFDRTHGVCSRCASVFGDGDDGDDGGPGRSGSGPTGMR